ncbi:hypothetical protein PUN28_007849 [Cardiocondyla obscurior]|uniref:GIY-YIG domain-containing protein n=1 Tax=Cardiocondyla obscurior TaxID=286306 RepID=A0AAW2FWN7_9HYME
MKMIVYDVSLNALYVGNSHNTLRRATNWLSDSAKCAEGRSQLIAKLGCEQKRRMPGREEIHNRFDLPRWHEDRERDTRRCRRARSRFNKCRHGQSAENRPHSCRRSSDPASKRGTFHPRAAAILSCATNAIVIFRPPSFSR